MQNTTVEIIERIGNATHQLAGSLVVHGNNNATTAFALRHTTSIDDDLAELGRRSSEMEQTYTALSKLISNLEAEAKAPEEYEIVTVLHGIDLDRCDSSGYFGARTGNCTPYNPCRLHLIVQRLHRFGLPLPSFWGSSIGAHNG